MTEEKVKQYSNLEKSNQSETYPKEILAAFGYNYASAKRRAEKLESLFFSINRIKKEYPTLYKKLMDDLKYCLELSILIDKKMEDAAGKASLLDKELFVNKEK